MFINVKWHIFNLWFTHLCLLTLRCPLWSLRQFYARNPKSVCGQHEKEVSSQSKPPVFYSTYCQESLPHNWWVTAAGSATQILLRVSTCNNPIGWWRLTFLCRSAPELPGFYQQRTPGSRVAWQSSHCDVKQRKTDCKKSCKNKPWFIWIHLSR